MHPLTKEDLDLIKTNLKGINDVRAILVRAKTAGIDVSGQETELDVNEARLKAILVGFFPTGRA